MNLRRGMVVLALAERVRVPAERLPDGIALLHVECARLAPEVLWFRAGGLAEGQPIGRGATGARRGP